MCLNINHYFYFQNSHKEFQKRLLSTGNKKSNGIEKLTKYPQRRDREKKKKIKEVEQRGNTYERNHEGGKEEKFHEINI